MESVFNMLRPLHFVLLLSAFAFFALASAVEPKENSASFHSEIESPATSDLEAEASAYYGYGRPYYGGWGYGRGYYPGGYYRGGYWGGRGYGRGYGGWGGYGGGYWG